MRIGYRHDSISIQVCILLWIFTKTQWLREFIILITGQEKLADIPNEWLDMSRGCIREVRRQIQAEVDASMQYLAMGAHFAKDTVNRPGFSEFFFNAAGEEREHATKLIEYLLMRGQLTDDVSSLITVNVSVVSKRNWLFKWINW